MTKLLNLIIVLLAALLIFVIIYPQVQQNRPLTVKFACDSTIASLPILVGVEESLFAREKIIPQVSFYSDPDKALDDVMTGKIDVGVFPWSTVIRRIAEKGDTLMVLMNEDYRQSLPVDAIVALMKSRVAGVADLKGRKLGYPPQVRDYLPLFLTNAGLAAEQVTLVETSLGSLMADLDRGAIDAAWVIEPLVCALDSTRYRRIQAAALARYVSQPFPGACIGFSKAYAKRSRVASGRLKVATDAAVAFSEGKSDQAREIVSRYLKYCVGSCGFCRLPEMQRLNEINRPSIAALSTRLKVAGVIKNDVETKGVFVDPSTLKR